MCRLKILLFQSIAIELDGEPVTGFRSHKALALLGYLALTQRAVARATLADMFWGQENSETVARTELRRVLHNISTQLPNTIRTTRRDVEFKPDLPYVVDALKFSQLLTPDADVETMQQAVDLYNSELMDGLAVQTGTRFEDWLAAERTHYAQQTIQALNKLVTHYAQQRNPENGLPQVNKLLRLDPFNEWAHRQKMSLLAHNDQLHAALAQYDICRKMLEDEFSVTPSAETIDLLERIRASRRPRPHNIPADLSRFVGRAPELETLWRCLIKPDERLITITGEGGIGKTRLALELAYNAAYDKTGLFRNGVIFVPLSGLNSADEILILLAKALQIPVDAPKLLKPRVIEHLRSREMLLLFDNFEHLLAGASLLGQLIADAPRVTLLITSRERLQLNGEKVFELDGLRYPAVDSAESINSFDAVKLFVHRAQNVKANFVLTSENEAAVAEICRLLEGMPLGIELAANWISIIEPDAIVREIKSNIDFLATSQLNRPNRHKSLRAVFNYSWKLLPPLEQKVLAELSIFANGFERDAAQQITSARLPTMLSLQNKSLVRRHRTAGRYRIHEQLRQFALEQLNGDDNFPQSVFERHSHYYLNFVKEREADLKGARQIEGLNEFAQDFNNIRLAVEHAARQGDYQALSESLIGLNLFLDMRSWYAIGKELMVSTHVIVQADTEQSKLKEGVLAVLQLTANWHDMRMGQLKDVIPSTNACMPIIADLRWDKWMPIANFLLGSAQLWGGEYTNGLENLEASLNLYRKIEDDWGIAIVNVLLAQMYEANDEFETARHYCRTGLQISHAIGDTRGVGIAEWTLGRIARRSDMFDTAKAHFLACKEINETLGDLRTVANALSNLGAIERQQHEYEAARHYFLRTFQIANHIQAESVAVEALYEVARLYADTEQSERAFLLAEIASLRSANTVWYKQGAAQLCSQLRACLSPEQIAKQKVAATSVDIPTLVKQLIEELR